MVLRPVFFMGCLRCLRCQFLRRFLLLPGTVLPMWRFFPQFCGFCASFAAFCSFQGIFCACTCIPLLHLWCCLFAPCASPPLRPSPAVAGLVGFHCSPPHWLSLRLCVGPFWPFLLGMGLAVVEPLAAVYFCASSCGACGFSHSVSCRRGLH